MHLFLVVCSQRYRKITPVHERARAGMAGDMANVGNKFTAHLHMSPYFIISESPQCFLYSININMTDTERSSLTRALPPISRGPSDSGSERFSPNSVLDSTLRSSLTKLKPSALDSFKTVTEQPTATSIPTPLSAGLPQLLPSNSSSLGRSNRFNKLTPLAPLGAIGSKTSSVASSELLTPSRPAMPPTFVTAAPPTEGTDESPELTDSEAASPPRRSPLVSRSRSLPQQGPPPIAPAPPIAGPPPSGPLGAAGPRRPAGRAALSTCLGLPGGGALPCAGSSSSYNARMGSLTADPPSLKKVPVEPAH